MHTKCTRVRRFSRGFSMLEVMIVVVIIGILASIIVPNILGQKEKADKQKAITDITALENALQMYYLDNNRYPTTEQGLEALVQKPTSEPLPRSYPNQGYIRRLPEDPWGNPYQMLNPGEHGEIDIFSMGKDGEAGTISDIGNWNMQDVR